MVDRAETDAIRDGRESLRIDIGGDVGSVEQPLLLQPADGALTSIRRDDPAAKTRLMDSDARLSHDVAALERILDQLRLPFVEWTSHSAR